MAMAMTVPGQHSLEVQSRALSRELCFSRPGGAGGGLPLKAVEKALNVSRDGNSQAFIKQHQGAWSARNTSHFKCPLF